MLSQFVANAICSGSVVALVALGFAIVYNCTGVFHIAHGALIVAAAYIAYFMAAAAGFPLPVAFVMGLVGSALLAALTEILVYRPLYIRQAPAPILLISSLGVYVVLVNSIAMLFGNETRVLRPGAAPTLVFGSVSITDAQALQVISAFLVILAGTGLLRWTHFGRTLRAITDSPVLSEVLGINVRSLRFVAIVMGTLVASLGMLLGSLDIGIEPNVGFEMVLVAATACIVAGKKSLLAPVSGAFLLALLQNLVVWKTSARWTSAATFSLLSFFLLVRPQGIFGTQRRVEEN